MAFNLRLIAGWDEIIANTKLIEQPPETPPMIRYHAACLRDLGKGPIRRTTLLSILRKAPTGFEFLADRFIMD